VGRIEALIVPAMQMAEDALMRVLCRTQQETITTTSLSRLAPSRILQAASSECPARFSRILFGLPIRKLRTHSYRTAFPRHAASEFVMIEIGHSLASNRVCA
jgi:hypothetical protein